TKRAIQLVQAFEHDIKTHHKLIAQQQAQTIKDAAKAIASETAGNLKPLSGPRLVPAMKRLMGMSPSAADERAGDASNIRRFFNEGATRFEQMLLETSDTLHRIVYGTMSERRNIALSVKHRAYDELE